MLAASPLDCFERNFPPSSDIIGTAQSAWGGCPLTGIRRVTVEPIDQAFENFKRSKSAIESYRASVVTEEDTRLKVINPILTDVLQYSMEDIFTEDRAGKGFIDYRINIDGFARLVVEAKRDGRDFQLANRTSARAYKLNGPVFKAEAAEEGILQAIGYCALKNAELACVTNGREWIIFRGNRLGDGTDTLDGKAFVFSSLDEIEKNFALFYDLIGKTNVSSFLYRAHFQEMEGIAIRSSSFRKALRSADSRQALPMTALLADVDRVMSSFFRRLTGDDDPALLAKCFVITRESQIADERLARISEDLIGRVRSMNTDDGEGLTEIIDRVKNSHRNEFVLLIGTKGAGKTTFIDRFFRMILKKELAEECKVARVNLADSGGSERTIIEWLDVMLADALERAVFEDGIASYEDLQGIYFDEYQRWMRGSQKFLYERDKQQFKEKFGDFVEQQRKDERHDYIKRLVRDVSLNRKKIPCIVFDNADHFTIEFQERVFQYARSIYENALCLVIMPITDRTSWQLSREGALRSFENESLFLPTPSNRVVLKKRIEFLEERLSREKPEEARRYFVGRGITLSLENLTAFTAALQTIFIATGKVARWIGNLANNDIRRCLEIAKSLVTSPHLEVEALISSYVAHSSVHIPPFKVLKALIKGNYDIYPYGMHPYIRNAYAPVENLPGSPLTGLRILRMLLDARSSNGEDPFVAIEQVVSYFAAIGIEPSVTIAWLKPLLEFGLCQSYDPTLTDIADVRKMQISPAGVQHLLWATSDTDYMQAMLEVTPILDEAWYSQLIAMRENSKPTWFEELSTFIDYLLAEDGKFCSISEHPSLASQRGLSNHLLNVISRLGSRLGLVTASPDAAGEDIK